MGLGLDSLGTISGSSNFFSRSRRIVRWTERAGVESLSANVQKRVPLKTTVVKPAKPGRSKCWTVFKKGCTLFLTSSTLDDRFFTAENRQAFVFAAIVSKKPGISNLTDFSFGLRKAGEALEGESVPIG